MTKIRIGEIQYPAGFTGARADSKWGGRESVSIRLAMTAVQADTIFQNGLVWTLVEEVTQEDGITETVEHDMSAYCVAGEITDHRDGNVTVKMGKKADLEIATREEILRGATVDELLAKFGRI